MTYGKVRDYELKALFTYVIDVLERLDIPYMVVGGFAAILYGEPRLMIDVDKVDLVPVPQDLFTRAALERRRRMEYGEAGHSATFIRYSVVL